MNRLSSLATDIRLRRSLNRIRRRLEAATGAEQLAEEHSSPHRPLRQVRSPCGGAEQAQRGRPPHACSGGGQPTARGVRLARSAAGSGPRGGTYMAESRWWCWLVYVRLAEWDTVRAPSLKNEETYASLLKS